MPVVIVVVSVATRITKSEQVHISSCRYWSFRLIFRAVLSPLYRPTYACICLTQWLYMHPRNNSLWMFKCASPYVRGMASWIVGWLCEYQNSILVEGRPPARLGGHTDTLFAPYLEPLALLFDLDILNVYPHTKNEVSTSRLSKVRASEQENWQTHIQTRPNVLPCRICRWQSRIFRL